MRRFGINQLRVAHCGYRPVAEGPEVHENAAISSRALDK